MTKPDDNSREAIHAIRQAEPEPGKDRRAAGRVQRFAWVVLVLMALLALLALGTDVSNYVRAIDSAHGLSFSIASVQVIDDDNPRALVHLRVRNDAPLEIELVRYAFELGHNGERVGSSYSTYLGTDDSIDGAAHRDTANIHRVLAPGRALDLEFTVFIYATHMDSIRRARPTSSSIWTADAEFITILPYSRQETPLRLRGRLEE
jgi:hypothetical protein